MNLLTKVSSIDEYKAAVERLVGWCDVHHLLINVKKTEEVIIDARSVGDRSSVVIHGQDIKQEASYKYLGVHIDSELKWHIHVSSFFVHQRLHFLRRLRLYGVSSNIMLFFFLQSHDRVCLTLRNHHLVWVTGVNGENESSNK